MSKLLNLTLHYKGKKLDQVRYGRDFKNKFFIGSDKYLFWQILDEKFPEKHLFVTKKGDQLYLQLPPGAKVSCAKDGEPVDESFLTKSFILQGNKLLLRPDMTGTLAIAPNWEISYEFKEPYVSVLTPEQQQIAAQYACRPQPTAEEKFSRNMILLFVILTVIFVIIFDLFLKKQVSYDTTLEQKLQTIQKAERIQAEALAKPSTFEEAGEYAEVARPVQALTLMEGFVTSRPGGGGGGGAGPGVGGAGPGGGVGGTTFDPNATRSFTSDIGSVATKAPTVRGSEIRPEGVAIVKASGDQSKLMPSGVAFGKTAVTEQTLAKFKSKQVTQVTEETISQAPAERQTIIDEVRRAVEIRKGQIQSLYMKWNATIPFSGSVKIRLLINASGKVQDAIITPEGNMPNGFLTELEQLCESWSFPINEEFDYEFKFRLRKG